MVEIRGAQGMLNLFSHQWLPSKALLSGDAPALFHCLHILPFVEGCQEGLAMKIAFFN